MTPLEIGFVLVIAFAAGGPIAASWKMASHGDWISAWFMLSLALLLLLIAALPILPHKL